MLDTAPERELPRESWRTIFHRMDAEIDRLVDIYGMSREAACEKIAGHALARQAEAGQQAAREAE